MSKKSSKAKQASQKPTIRRVSGRDLEIYQQVAVEGQKQKLVGLEKKITQPRVSKIVKRVGLWLSDTVPEGLAELPREQRLNVAARTHRMKLDWMYDQAAEAWQESKKSLKTIKEKVIKGEAVLETTVKSQVGNFRLLDGAYKMAERKIVFDGFSLDGKVDISCKGRPFEMPPQTEDEMMAGLKADYDVLYPQLVKWEAEKKERERKERESGGGGEREKENHFATSLATCSGAAEVRNSGRGEIDESRVMIPEGGSKSAEVNEVLSCVVKGVCFREVKVLSGKSRFGR